MSMSTVTILGNLTAQPEIVVLPNGTELARITVASSRNRLTDGEWVSGETTFLEVECWDDLGRHVISSLRKGMAVIAHGRLETNRWRDKEGNPRSKMRLRAVTVGPDLRRCEGRITRVRRDDGPSTADSAATGAAAGDAPDAGATGGDVAAAPSFPAPEGGILARPAEADGGNAAGDAGAAPGDGSGGRSPEAVAAPF